MTVPFFFFVGAFFLSLWSVWDAKGRSAVCWAVLMIAAGLIWSQIPNFH